MTRYMIDFVENLEKTTKNGYRFFNRIFFPIQIQNHKIFSIHSLNLTRFLIHSMRSRGKINQILGDRTEEIIFYSIGALNITKTIPINNKLGIRVTDPDNKRIEFDIIVHNSNYLIVIESKHWLLSERNEVIIEIKKFERKIAWLNNNKNKFGFSKDLLILPIFYLPYPPFPKYNEVILLSSPGNIN
ncbi:MAG: hypothetical protein HeimC3_12170 [Candidatus Heimdallarchaeota archaeon LC_3]|nr:MAG: hypothetical protein HeimC3_12170 [Candidatus Heimdallarchaeota archaeon LC_3]